MARCIITVDPAYNNICTIFRSANQIAPTKPYQLQITTGQKR